MHFAEKDHVMVHAYNNNSNNTTNTNTNTNNRPAYKCPKCSQSFASLDGLIAHGNDHQEEEEQIDGQFFLFFFAVY